MRILMLGRGVIATIHGWALTDAGHHVEHLVRPGRAASLGDSVALDVLDARRSPTGARVTGRVPVVLRETVSPDDGFDLVIVSVGHHRLASAAAQLAPMIGDATVLVFGNVWDEPADAVAPISPEQVVLGFPQAGGGFDDDGVLHGALMRRVLLGVDPEPTPRQLAVRAVLRSAGLAVSEQADMRGWLWTHMVADAGMHAAGLRHGSLAALAGDRAGLRDALLTARELLPVLTARGVDLRRHRSSTLLFRAPVAVTSAAMAWATGHVGIARASLAAHTDPRADEPVAVLRDVLAEARRLGVAAPRLQAVEPLIAEPA